MVKTSDTRPTDAELIGQAIRTARTRAGRSLEETASVVAISGAYLSKIENGHIKAPRREILERLSRELDEPKILDLAIQPSDSHGTVFVAMPSGDNFDVIFRELIQEPLTNEGYRVVRAVDLATARNILADIVQGIDGATFVVADLTGLNPNVLYEVGMAHALEKSTILLTQQIEEVPFDLRSYRVLTYRLHFTEARELSADLIQRLKAIQDDDRLASGPFADFAEIKEGLSASAASELGIFDYLEDIDRAFAEAVPTITSINSTIGKMTARANVLAEEFSNSPGGNHKVSRKAAVRAARDFETLAQELGGERLLFEQLIVPVEEHMGSLLREVERGGGIESAETAKMIEVLNEVGSSARGAENATRGAVTVIDKTPRLERRLTAAMRHIRTEMAGIAEAYASVRRFCERGLAELGEELRDAPGGS